MLKKWWFWLAAVLVAGGVAVIIGLQLQKSETAQGVFPEKVKGLAACSVDKKLLQYSPLKVDDIMSIIPLGNFAPPGHIIPTTHLYFRYQTAAETKTLKTIVYAPADMTVTAITKYDNGSATEPFDSYRLDFALCREVRGYFIHVVTLSDRLRTAFHEPYDDVQTSDVGSPKPDHNYLKKVSIKLTAGEVIGTAGGDNRFPDALDFGLQDARVAAATVANPDRYDTASLHFVCPLDYYPAAVSRQLDTLFGGYSLTDKVVGEPRCGEIYQDMPGTARGVWVSKDTDPTALWDVRAQLTLGQSNFNHQQEVFAIGAQLATVGLDTNALYSFTPTETGFVNTDFGLVKPGQVRCYETQPNNNAGGRVAIVIQLVDATHLKIGKNPSSSCSNVPTSLANMLEYVR